jgi:hypothetical protein
MKKLGFAAAVAAVSLLAATSAVFAEDVTCNGVLPPGTYDSITVPPNASCAIAGSIVKGNITALDHAMLLVATSEVGGSIKGDQADVIHVFTTSVGHNIHVEGGGPVPGFVFEVAICGTTLRQGHIHIERMTGDFLVGDPAFGCAGNTVSGNIKVQDNNVFAFKLNVATNTVGGHVEVANNSGVGPKFVQLNSVGKKLKCEGNAPPFVGGPNVAAEAEGQCF